MTDPGTRRPPGEASPRQCYLWPSRLLPAFAALLLLACGGEGPGTNSNQDATTDGGADAQVADAFVFDCPAEQPEGTQCFRGQVTDLLTDAPVAMPPGSVVKWYRPSEAGRFPDILADQAEVQPDGRFIFPHAPYERFDFPDDPRLPSSYSYADLRLESTLDGSILPDNKYGFMCPECFPQRCYNCTIPPPPLPLFVIPAGVFEIWNERIETMAYDPYGVCQTRSLLPEVTFKMAISVQTRLTWGDDPNMAHYVTESGAAPAAHSHPSGEQHCVFHVGELDRLWGPFLQPLQGFAGIGVIPVYQTPVPGAELIFGTMEGHGANLPKHPMWAAIGPSALDHSGPIVVINYWEWMFLEQPEDL